MNVSELEKKCFAALNDDMNSPIAIAHLFDGVKMINSIKAGNEKISVEDVDELKEFFKTTVFDILGLKEEKATDSGSNEILEGAIDLLLKLRMEAKANKDWGTADKIRNELNALGVEIKDTKDGFEWNLK